MHDNLALVIMLPLIIIRLIMISKHHLLHPNNVRNHKPEYDIFVILFKCNNFFFKSPVKNQPVIKIVLYSLFQTTKTKNGTILLSIISLIHYMRQRRDTGSIKAQDYLEPKKQVRFSTKDEGERV